jgi:cation diffusion facilitator family transporter
MRAVRRVTLVGLVINLVLAALKFALGVAGRSQALVTDAVHSLSDCVTDVMVILGAPFWSAPADAEHPYGHGRIETVVTLAIGAFLAAAGAGMGYRAFVSLAGPPPDAPGWAALVGAIVSITIKEALYQWTARTGRRVKSSALVANAWHHRSDALSSVPVAAVVLGTMAVPGWTFLDPLGAVIVSLMILHAAWRIMRPAMDQLIDRGATRAERGRLRELARGTHGVMAVHALRTRYIGSGLYVDLHVLVEPELTVREGHNIAGAVKQRLLTQGADVVDVLVHIEPYDAEHHAERTENSPDTH